MTKKLSYRTALLRIEEIIDQIENQQPDVDTLTELVKEASTLISACKDKLGNAETDLSETLKKIG